VTSTARSSAAAERKRRTGAGLLGLVVVIGVGWALGPLPWSRLWPLLPVVGAAALLLTQTQVPVLGWFLPALVVAALVALGEADRPWAWCLTAGTLAATLLGVAERRGTEWSRRTWAFLPLVVLAAGLPLAPGYAELVSGAIAGIKSAEAEQLAALGATAMTADQKTEVVQALAALVEMASVLARNILPALLFAWAVLLVVMAERMARRLADIVRRPLAPTAPLSMWRMPDAAVWFLVAGLALVVSRDARAMPVGINLATSIGLAFALQGFAVVQSFLATSGMTPGLVTLLFVFVALAMWPVLPVGCAGVGLMDVWLDFRRLEPHPYDEEPEGGKPWK
jgi:hypothetical protein